MIGLLPIIGGLIAWLAFGLTTLGIVLIAIGGVIFVAWLAIVLVAVRTALKYGKRLNFTLWP